MRVRSIVWLAGLVVCAGGCVASQAPRYHVAAGADGNTYEIDSQTGRVWVLDGGPTPEKTELHESGASDGAPADGGEVAVEPLPEAERAKYEIVRWWMNERSFGAETYSGSSWRVTDAVVTVTAVEPDGAVRWTRDFDVRINDTPRSPGYFHFEVNDAEDLDYDACRWEFKELLGRPD